MPELPEMPKLFPQPASFLAALPADLPLGTRVLINLDWQWKNTLKRSEMHIEYHTDGETTTTTVEGSSITYEMLDCLYEYNFGNKKLAFEYVVAGQGHNQDVQNDYRNFVRQEGIDDFWNLVIKASKYLTAQQENRGYFQTNIKWQRLHNWETLKQASKAFETENDFKGMYFLLYGQRHNRNVMAQYRYFFRVDPKFLKDVVHHYADPNTPTPSI